jgi:hypothetical protein
MGFIGYYRRFVKDFARIIKPLDALLKRHEPKKEKQKSRKVAVTARVSSAMEIDISGASNLVLYKFYILTLGSSRILVDRKSLTVFTA